MKKTIPVIGMACSVCSANVEKKLQSLEGINSASVSLASRTALVDYNPDIISLEDMKREISNAGYDLVIESNRSVEEINRREFTLLRRRTLASWLFAILTMCFSMGWISLGMEQNMISDGVASAHHSSSFANQICLLLALANLLYCRIEGIHVDVYDFSLFHLSCCLFAYLQFCFRMQKYTLFMKEARIRKEIMGYRHKKRQIPNCLGICLNHLWEMII